MKIEELITLHRESLHRKVDEDPYRPERLKARLRENLQPRTLPFRRSVVLYGLLLVIFTFINFMVIGGLKGKQVSSSANARAELVSLESLASHLTAEPGSISHAYEEVMK